MNLRTFFRRLFCQHPESEWIRNIYGDQIIEYGGCRSLWRCTECGSIFPRWQLRN